MEKYGTYVTFKNVKEPGTIVEIPLDEAIVIDEMTKSAEWELQDSLTEETNGDKEKS